MGILAPIFLGGLAALALPLIFHLVRRTPRGRQVFSSLMFLSPSPPRLTRRSRLEQILLLLLRLAALALVALAFSRPFLREAALLSFSDLPERRVAILLDTSASMRRGDLWRQAIAQVRHELDQLAPHDEVALFTFDDRVRTVIGFDSATADQASRAELIRQQVTSLKATWGATDLGSALTGVASELDAASDALEHAAEPQVVLISDFQKGAALDALQAYEWPERVRVIARQLEPAGKTNAFAQLLVGEEGVAAAELRVRVASAANSTGDQFFVRWESDKPSSSTAKSKADGEDEVAVYVPPGQSRVVKLPRPENNREADRIVLRGDDQEFDNAFYVVPIKQREVKLLYAGADQADDPQGLSYYLQLATSDDALWKVTIEPLTGDDTGPLASDPLVKLVVVSRAVSSELQARINGFVEQGGTLLVVPIDREAAALVPALLDDVELGEAPAAEEGQFLLLGELDFTHPLFLPFAQPRYSDFTKIHFWRHQPVTLAQSASEAVEKTHVVARFDNGDPAVLDRSLGKGRVLAFTSGWRPDDSQLALSSKFVPLVGALLEQACGGGPALASVTVGQSVALPEGNSAASLIHTPDGRDIKLAAGAKNFDQTAEPGVYSARSTADESQFAVNLAPAESNTAPLDLEQLEQLGVLMGQNPTRAERLDRIRQQRDTELEGRQKIWRWLLLGALAVLVFETWWAGLTARQINRAQSDRITETAS